ncbi:MAG TPA: hypothetical protein VFH03_03240 [Actinoplanes sp.]|nr:hypothetical protein [Actinoplanes sp.]
MTINRTDLVTEYLHEVDFRLSGLPLLQRRELLADLHAHIAEARLTAPSEGELIEILERLGSPEEVAAAAYAEAGQRPPVAQPPVPPPPMPPSSGGWPAWLTAVIVAAVVLFLCALLGGFFLVRGSSPDPAGPPALEAPPAPVAPR